MATKTRIRRTDLPPDHGGLTMALNGLRSLFSKHENLGILSEEHYETAFRAYRSLLDVSYEIERAESEKDSA